MTGKEGEGRGLKEKIKEKLTGGGKHAHGVADYPSTSPPAGQHEKKGMIEKIKEKLPGHHDHH